MPSKSGKASQREEVYWDSCMFMEHISPIYPERAGVMDHLVSLAKDKKILVVTSALTKAEVLRGPGTDSLPEDHRRYLASYFENEWITVRATDGLVWDQAALLRRESQGIDNKGNPLKGLDLADAVHIATALRWGLTTIETFDEKHLVSRDGKLGNSPLKIRLPIFRDVPPLFEGVEDMPS